MSNNQKSKSQVESNSLSSLSMFNKLVITPNKSDLCSMTNVIDTAIQYFGDGTGKDFMTKIPSKL